MNGAKLSIKGFTIVELLIVIVVIGILAAISIVTYSGIQDRALNSSRNSAARQVYSLLELYKVDHGSYPEVPNVWPGMNGACLGEGWPEFQGQEICWNIYDHLVDGSGSYIGSTFFKDDSVDQALASYGRQPDYPQTPVWTGNHATGGAMNQNALALIYNDQDEPIGGGLYSPGYSLVWLISEGADCTVLNATKERFLGGEGSTVCIAHLE